MASLNISDSRERALVRAGDVAFAIAAPALRSVRVRRATVPPRRILLLRLERIGDLLMTAPAIADVRASAPDAEVDLVVGSWNLEIARALPGISRVETLDAAWLAREGTGQQLPALLRAARRWKQRQYDLAINFEPDVRSNLMLALSGAGRKSGFRSGGGGPLLDDALDYDVRAHTTDNARRLVARVFDREPAPHQHPPLVIPEAIAKEAARLLPARTPLIGLHASGGRAIKQWDPERFAAVAARLVAERQATIVLTGAPGDGPVVDLVRRRLPGAATIDLSGGVDLLTLAAALSRLDLFITGDTGPMHLAAAVGTPIVAVFGPSDPARYAPRGPHDRIVRVDLPCSPCNRIRLPPERCVGHTPDCLSLVTIDRIYEAASAILDATRSYVAGRTAI